MPDRPVLAYIRPGPHPYANTSVETVLRDQFPEYEVVTIDVVDRLRADKRWTPRAALHALRFYGGAIAQKQLRAKDAILRTPFAFRSMRALILEELRDRPVVATFQIQSLFDAHLDGVPHFVYTDHTHLANLGYPAFDRRKLLAEQWIDCEQSIYDNATHVFVRSSHVQRSLQKDYGVPDNKITVAYAGPNSADVERTGPTTGYGSKNIAFVGVDWKRKGGPELLAAFALVRGRVPDATLTIAGTDPEVSTPGVTVLGRIPLPEVNDVLGQAAVFCLPTHIEPFGIAFVEAMTHSLPIVGTRIGAVPDMVEDGVNGRVVDVGDVSALVDALCELVTDEKKCKAFGAASRQRVETRYSWAKVGASFRTVIENALS